MTKGVVLILLAFLLALTSCAGQAGDQPAPGDPTGRVVNDPTTEASGEPEQERGPTVPDAEPTHAGPGVTAFALGDIAQFDDGLQIEVAGAVATKAKKGYQGAEATNGEIVVVAVRIENGTEEEYPAESVIVSATYGTDTPAAMITDPTGELQRGFVGVVPLEGELVAPLGFAIPFDAVGKVTVTVDCRDDIHPAITFSGRVERDQ
ncbi:MAG TPA: hypothetical protein VFP89_09045 [Propionibacteriaceae bacterium]|nr:hypothetical protein [Propionibacteriaceae bacterium]